MDRRSGAPLPAGGGLRAAPSPLQATASALAPSRPDTSTVAPMHSPLRRRLRLNTNQSHETAHVPTASTTGVSMQNVAAPPAHSSSASAAGESVSTEPQAAGTELADRPLTGKSTPGDAKEATSDDPTHAWFLRGRRAMLASLGVHEMDGAVAVADVLRAAASDRFRRRMREMISSTGPPGVVYLHPRLLASAPRFWAAGATGRDPSTLRGTGHDGGLRLSDREPLASPTGMLTSRTAAQHEQLRDGSSPELSPMSSHGTPLTPTPPSHSGTSTGPFSVKRYAAGTYFVPPEHVHTWRSILQKPPMERSDDDIAALDSGCMSRVKQFMDVPAALRHFMLRQSEFVTLQPTEALFRQGDAGDGVYIVLSGFVQVRMDMSAVPLSEIDPEDLRRYENVNESGIINTLGPLEGFGERALQNLFSSYAEAWEIAGSSPATAAEGCQSGKEDARMPGRTFFPGEDSDAKAAAVPSPSLAFRRLMFLLRRTVEVSDIKPDGSLDVLADELQMNAFSKAAAAADARRKHGQDSAIDARFHPGSLLHVPESPRALDIQRQLHSLLCPEDGSTSLRVTGGRRVATVVAAPDTVVHLLRIPAAAYMYVLARNRREVQDIATYVMRRTDIFKPWAEKLLSRLAATAQKCTFRPGDVIARQGDVADGMYILLLGHCRVIRAIDVDDTMYDRVQLALNSPASKVLQPDTSFHQVDPNMIVAQPSNREAHKGRAITSSERGASTSRSGAQNGSERATRANIRRSPSQSGDGQGSTQPPSGATTARSFSLTLPGQVPSARVMPSNDRAVGAQRPQPYAAADGLQHLHADKNVYAGGGTTRAGGPHASQELRAQVDELQALASARRAKINGILSPRNGVASHQTTATLVSPGGISTSHTIDGVAPHDGVSEQQPNTAPGAGSPVHHASAVPQLRLQSALRSASVAPAPGLLTQSATHTASIVQAEWRRRTRKRAVFVDVARVRRLDTFGFADAILGTDSFGPHALPEGQLGNSQSGRVSLQFTTHVRATRKLAQAAPPHAARAGSSEPPGDRAGAAIPRAARRRSSLTAMMEVMAEAARLGHDPAGLVRPQSHGAPSSAAGRRHSLPGQSRRPSTLEAQARATIAAPHVWSQTLVAETRVEALFVPRVPALLDICLADPALTQKTWETAIKGVPSNADVLSQLDTALEWAKYRTELRDDVYRDHVWRRIIAGTYQHEPAAQLHRPAENGETDLAATAAADLRRIASNDYSLPQLPEYVFAGARSAAAFDQYASGLVAAAYDRRSARALGKVAAARHAGARRRRMSASEAVLGSRQPPPRRFSLFADGAGAALRHSLRDEATALGVNLPSSTAFNARIAEMSDGLKQALASLPSLKRRRSRRKQSAGSSLDRTSSFGASADEMPDTAGQESLPHEFAPDYLVNACTSPASSADVASDSCASGAAAAKNLDVGAAHNEPAEPGSAAVLLPASSAQTLCTMPSQDLMRAILATAGTRKLFVAPLDSDASDSDVDASPAASVTHWALHHALYPPRPASQTLLAEQVTLRRGRRVIPPVNSPVRTSAQDVSPHQATYMPHDAAMACSAAHMEPTRAPDAEAQDGDAPPVPALAFMPNGPLMPGTRVAPAVPALSLYSSTIAVPAPVQPPAVTARKQSVSPRYHLPLNAGLTVSPRPQEIDAAHETALAAALSAREPFVAPRFGARMGRAERIAAAAKADRLVSPAAAAKVSEEAKTALLARWTRPKPAITGQQRLQALAATLHIPDDTATPSMPRSPRGAFRRASLKVVTASAVGRGNAPAITTAAPEVPAAHCVPMVSPTALNPASPTRRRVPIALTVTPAIENAAISSQYNPSSPGTTHPVNALSPPLQPPTLAGQLADMKHARLRSPSDATLGSRGAAINAPSAAPPASPGVAAARLLDAREGRRRSIALDVARIADSVLPTAVRKTLDTHKQSAQLHSIAEPDSDRRQSMVLGDTPPDPAALAAPQGVLQLRLERFVVPKQFSTRTLVAAPLGQSPRAGVSPSLLSWAARESLNVRTQTSASPGAAVFAGSDLAGGHGHGSATAENARPAFHDLPLSSLTMHVHDDTVSKLLRKRRAAVLAETHARVTAERRRAHRSDQGKPAASPQPVAASAQDQRGRLASIVVETMLAEVAAASATLPAVLSPRGHHAAGSAPRTPS